MRSSIRSRAGVEPVARRPTSTSRQRRSGATRRSARSSARRAAPRARGRSVAQARCEAPWRSAHTRPSRRPARRRRASSRTSRSNGAEPEDAAPARRSPPAPASRPRRPAPGASAASASPSPSSARSRANSADQQRLVGPVQSRDGPVRSRDRHPLVDEAGTAGGSAERSMIGLSMPSTRSRARCSPTGASAIMKVQRRRRRAAAQRRGSRPGRARARRAAPAQRRGEVDREARAAVRRRGPRSSGRLVMRGASVIGDAVGLARRRSRRAAAGGALTGRCPPAGLRLAGARARTRPARRRRSAGAAAQRGDRRVDRRSRSLVEQHLAPAAVEVVALTGRPCRRSPPPAGAPAARPPSASAAAARRPGPTTTPRSRPVTGSTGPRLSTGSGARAGRVRLDQHDRGDVGRGRPEVALHRRPELGHLLGVQVLRA